MELQEDKDESCKDDSVANIFSVMKHIGTVVLYGKYSEEQESGNIKKNIEHKIKFYKKCVTSVDDSKY